MNLLHVIQHTSADYLGLMEDHLEGRRIRFRYFRPFTEQGTVPQPGEKMWGQMRSASVRNGFKKTHLGRNQPPVAGVSSGPTRVPGRASPCRLRPTRAIRRDEPPAARIPAEEPMARKSRTAVLKRQREAKKAEKAAMKREKRVMREEDETGGQVATADDLAGYGFGLGEEEAEEPETTA